MCVWWGTGGEGRERERAHLNDGVGRGRLDLFYLPVGVGKGSLLGAGSKINTL